MKVAIVDYGMGNLGSVSRALAELGAEPFVAATPEGLADAERIIVPGVGNFAEGMDRLANGGWIETLRRQVADGLPLLGICLGMQLLASRGTEGGDRPGLDLIPGTVRRLDTLGCSRRIPHVGWNNVSFPRDPGPLFARIPDGTDFYFVHSFAFQATRADDVIALTDYDIPVVAAIGCGRVMGTQFHPEKSSKAGLRLLRNFLGPLSC